MRKLVALWILQLVMIVTVKVATADTPRYPSLLSPGSVASAFPNYMPAGSSQVEQIRQIVARLEVRISQASCESIELVAPNRAPDSASTGTDAAVIQSLLNRLAALEAYVVEHGVDAATAHRLVEGLRIRSNELIRLRCGEDAVLLYHGVEK